MDIIFIEKLTVMVIIGAYNWEQQLLQKLVFDVEMGWDNNLAAYSDNIADCLNYNDVNEIIVSLANKKRYVLIESFAEETASTLMQHFNLPWIRIKLSKPGAIQHAVNVGVIIERVR